MREYALSRCSRKTGAGQKRDQKSGDLSVPDVTVSPDTKHLDLAVEKAVHVGAGAEPDLSALLSGAADSLSAVWPDRPSYAAKLRDLGDRLVAQRLQIAVLGQFKRGKSTLLNALLGTTVLPTGIVPLTAIPTFIKWGPEAALQVTYLDNPPQAPKPSDATSIAGTLHRLVTEEGNPHNREKVARVDLSLPAPILRHGIVLIDTPGIGSTYEHNTDAALRVLPECDAALFVLSVDPPMTAAEFDYLDRIGPHAARIFFILNKIDSVDDADRAIAAGFLHRTLREHVAGTEIRIFSLSARQALDAKAAGDTKRLAASGLPALERYLEEFLATEKATTLRQAVAAKATTLLEAAGLDIALAIRALELPLDDLEARAARFAEALRDIARQRRAAQDLLAGDRRRALGDLEARAATLRLDARAKWGAIVDRTFKGAAGPEVAERTVRVTIEAAIPEFFGARFTDVSGVVATQIEETLGHHVTAAEQIIGAVRQQAATLFDIPAIPAAGADAFVMVRDPFWVTQKWDQTLGSLAGGILQKLLPASLRTVQIQRRLLREIDELVQRNVENLRWATLQNLEDAFRRFSGWFDERFDEAIAATHGAIEAALAKRKSHQEEAEQELPRLRDAADYLAAARRDLLRRVDVSSRVPAAAPGDRG